MKRKGLVIAIVILFLAPLTWYTIHRLSYPKKGSEPSAFAREVNLLPLETAAVLDGGRLKSFDSHARQMMQFMCGPHRIDGQSPAFTYLDLMFRPDAYREKPTIYVKNKPMREEMAEALRVSSPDVRFDAFMETGLISRRSLSDPNVLKVIEQKRQDLIKTASLVQALESAVAVMQPDVLGDSLQIIPPPGGGVHDRWLTVNAYVGVGAQPGAAGSLPAKVATQWLALGTSWQKQDAAGVNAAAVQLAELLREVNPGLYPPAERLAWESWYFRSGNMTWVWLIYLLAVCLLTMSVIYRWNKARWLGISVFLLAFGFHTFAVMLRWYVSGRWPNSNMFEAITTSAWFGGCGAIVLELLGRRTAMRGLFALGSAVASMIALMATRLWPLDLNANISNMMPVLHDIWLYIHTNVIIFSYILIFMAAVSAVLYLLYRIGGGQADHARVGGAGSLILKTPSGQSYLAENRSSAAQVFDGATMVLMELSFIMLWAGLVMGAIWADHSWGRPWGWDPKEVFALNTFIIFAILIHVRLKARDKGLWTAILAITGAAVMIFNWWVINFHIVGLHSYA